MSYNTELQSNNADLQAILAAVNALPEAGGSGGGGDSVKFVSILNTNVTYLLVNGVACQSGVPVDVPISTHPNAYSGFVFIAYAMNSVTFRYTDSAGNERTGKQEGLLQGGGSYGILNNTAVPAGTTITFEGSW